MPGSAVQDPKEVSSRDGSRRMDADDMVVYAGRLPVGWDDHGH